MLEISRVNVKRIHKFQTLYRARIKVMLEELDAFGAIVHRGGEVFSGTQVVLATKSVIGSYQNKDVVSNVEITT